MKQPTLSLIKLIKTKVFQSLHQVVGLRGEAEKNGELTELLGLRAQNYFELHVEEVKKRRNERKLQDNEHKLSDLMLVKMRYMKS